MQACVLRQLKEPLVLEERPNAAPEAGQVAIGLRAAALNRRDYWITQGKYPGIQLPVVLGSDGAGVVTAVGEGVAAEWMGAEVIINPGLNWGDNPRCQAGDFQILGMPSSGTLAESIVVAAEQIHRKPRHLDFQQAAALPLAGLTAYRALFTQGNLVENETVLVSGIGGGVATFLLQFALHAGARVIVTSSSREKIDRAKQLGAVAGFDYRTEDWHRQAQAEFGAIDLAVDGAAGASYAALVALASFGGRIVNYGATAGPPERLDMFQVFWKQLRLQGTTMGSPADFARMLDFVNTHQIVPVVDQVVALRDANSALARMGAGDQLGKIVVRI